MPELLVIIGSTRPGRIGLPVGTWFADLARDHGGFDVNVVDLADLDLPMLDEPHHPRLQRYEHEHTKSWSATVSRADAVVFVIPEYNFAITAPVKNCIDFLFNEWKYKPVGIVSYGGVSAGLRAAQQLKIALSPFPAPVVAPAVSIPFVQSFRDEDGVIQANDPMQAGAAGMLDELARWVPAMALLRS